MVPNLNQNRIASQISFALEVHRFISCLRSIQLTLIARPSQLHTKLTSCAFFAQVRLISSSVRIFFLLSLQLLERTTLVLCPPMAFGRFFPLHSSLAFGVSK
jgi:hypothetical protein